MDRVYLDYAASAPLRPEVREAMHKAEEVFGNPGSLHAFGQEAQAVVDTSREKIAKILGCNFRDLIFTGSATEANNLILRGILHSSIFGNQNSFSPAEKLSFPSTRGSSPNSETKSTSPAGYSPKILECPPRIIISAVEHDSIFETAQRMKKWGVEVEILPVSKNGEILEEELKKLLIKPAALVSIIAGQNEVGVTQNLVKISELIQAVRDKNGYPLFHTDAVQAFSHLPIEELKVADAFTLSAHKLGGPKGIGLLYIKEELQKKFLEPQITGGGQEFGLRAGTEDPIRIAGLTTAMEITSLEKEELNKKLTKLKTKMISGLREIFPDLKINGRPDLPHILNIHFPYRQAEDFLVALDLAGVAVAAGSACSARAQKPSRILINLGLSEAAAKESLRFSLGWNSSDEDIRKLLEAARKIADKN